MRLYRSIGEIGDLGGRPRAVAIGVFDGVHLGHRRIVREAVRAAADTGGVAMVLTFEPHPLAVLNPPAAPAVLTPLRMKLDLLEAEGVKETVAVPFDQAFASLSPADFCGSLLAGRLGARQVVVGANFRFGSKGTGTPEDLIACGATHGFAVTAIELVQNGGDAVSSTRIRALLGEGRVREVCDLLGRPYALAGFVEAGAGRGRDLGVPTANLALAPGVMVPGLGVYVSRTLIEGGRQEPSITSVGTNPTFESDGSVRVETFLLNFQGNLYGREIAVEFLERLRDQLTFTGPQALLEQMRLDIAQTKAYFDMPRDAIGAVQPSASAEPEW